MPRLRSRQLLPTLLGLWLIGCQLLTACSDNQSSLSITTTPTTSSPATTPLPATPVPATSSNTPASNNTPAATSGAVNPATATPGGTPSITDTITAIAKTRGDIPDISPYGSYQPFSQNWKVSLDATSAYAVIGEDSGLTFLKNAFGSLYALNSQTGATAWKITPTPAISGTVSSLPPVAVVAPGIVILGDQAADKVTAYDSKTGQKRWDFDLSFDAPERDSGARYLGAHVYGKVLVVGVSSKQNPYGQQTQTNNPEYLLIEGINLDTGKEVWSALTDPPTDPERPVRFGDMEFGTKYVLIESPDLTTGAIDAITGERKWRAVDLFLLGTTDPVQVDQVYSLVPDAGASHYPVLAHSDIETGKLLWQKNLPIAVINDPLITISPDGKTAYLSLIIPNSKSYIEKINLDTNVDEWQLETTRYGTYDMQAFNTGVRIRNFGASSGLAFIDKDVPNPELWFAGGVITGDLVDSKEGIYLTARDDKSGLLYLLDSNSGAVLSTSRTEVSASIPFVGQDQFYVAAQDSTGKPVIYAFKRPQP